MLKSITYLALITACFAHAGAVSVHHLDYDSVNHKIYRDTLYDRSLPAVEIDILTYSNFHYTTVGYEMVLRDTELHIKGVELYAGPENHRLNTLKPFSMHAGDSSERNRIDVVRIWNKFPFDTLSPSTDSLVVQTDRGNYTLYMGERQRRRVALDNQQKAFDRAMEKKESRFMHLIWLLGVLLMGVTVVTLGLNVRAKRRRDKMVNNLFILSSENERLNTEFGAKVQSLFKQKFETLNKLCFEYFEKSELPALRKSIYHEVEKEILRLREPAELASLEQSLNLYCNGIMTRADEQLPGLTAAERTLLIYIFSGLSARTICVLCDIEIKTYYMRRYRLKNKILAGDAPDKVYFAEKM